MITSDNINSQLKQWVALSRKSPDSALEQPFYSTPEFHRADMDAVFKQQWILVDHVSRIPEIGQYFLFEIDNESIIIIRQDEDNVNAFYNVCRHRGSRVCLEKEGRRKLMTCPYHAWSYGLDGALKAATLMPETFNKADYGLHACHVKVFEGLIFICLSKDAPPDFNSAYQDLLPLTQQQGISRAKIAVKRNYPNRANWKLVVENFIECYHCKSAHREYCSVHPQEKLLAFGAGPGSGSEQDAAAYQPVLDKWEAETQAMGHLIGSYDGGVASLGMQQAGRYPINSEKGFLSETMDGSPACKKLMGDFKALDGGQTALAFNPFSFIIASNDFALMLRWTPRDALNTDVELTWLVDKDAQEGVDYDPENLTKVWDITIKQDKKITEDNQAGVNSERYQPGPYSTQEARNISFKQWYLDHLEVSL
jgi:Rieske 2Fe-2S family protein